METLLTVSTSFNKSFGKGQTKTSRSASDDEDAIVQLSNRSVRLEAKGSSRGTHLEFSESVRCLRLRR